MPFVYVFIKKIGMKHVYSAAILRGIECSRFFIGETAGTAPETLHDFFHVLQTDDACQYSNLSHMLVITEDDSSQLRNEYDRFMRGKFPPDFPVAFESYPYHFTAGSGASRIVEMLQSRLKSWCRHNLERKAG